MLEKQRKNNLTIMAAGVLLAVLGIPLIFWIKPLGITMLIAGVVLLMLTWTISNFFFRIDIKEEFEGKKKDK